VATPPALACLNEPNRFPGNFSTLRDIRVGMALGILAIGATVVAAWTAHVAMRQGATLREPKARAGQGPRRRSDMTGTGVFIIANADTVVSRPNSTLIAEFYPDVEVRGDLGEHDTLLSIEKARRLLGYRPTYGWRETAIP
jgi:hypothetical protein